MLTYRQKKIVRELAEKSPNLLTADYFANLYEVSLRTVQNDFKKIREILEREESIELFSVVAKGTGILVHDETRFNELVKIDGENQIQSNQIERVRNLCLLLLQSRCGYSRQKLLDTLFIGSSTLTADLKVADKLLKPFYLTIDRRASKKIQIRGTELNKRLCLLHFGSHDYTGKQDLQSLQKEIENILLTVFIKYKFRISETLFQNLIVHISLAISRMRQGFFVKEKVLENTDDFDGEYQAAVEIYKYLGRHFYFTANEGELQNLAIYIRGKSDVMEKDYISDELNNHLIEILENIREVFNLNFLQNFDLRLSLAMHIVPLVTRVKYGIQNKNQLLDHIKQAFPLAFDLAAFTCLKLQEKIGQKIIEDEIAYLAIYFNQFLEEDSLSNKQSILVVTSLKRSLSILLRQRLLTWFPNKIRILTIVHKDELSEISIEDYEIIFTTEIMEVEHLGAIYISPYPGQNEYSKIKLAIDGFKDKQEVLSLFSQKRFRFASYVSKDEVLDSLCQMSGLPQQDLISFREAVYLREDLGSSYFKNHIALPHPISPIGSSTFISVILLEKPIQWDEDQNDVQLAMLVSIEKNNAKAFQLWNYLSAIIQDKQLIDRVLQSPDFETLRENISYLLEGYI